MDICKYKEVNEEKEGNIAIEWTAMVLLVLNTTYVIGINQTVSLTCINLGHRPKIPKK